jgi:hypothetical protein
MGKTFAAHITDQELTLLKYKKVLQVRKTLENRLGQNQVTDKEV